MRLLRIHSLLAILALGSGCAWPAETAPRRDSTVSGPGAALDRVFRKDEFRSFILEGRALEDSLHYRQGEIAIGQEEFDLALSHHLAADLPAAGTFRNDLLAQRSRIFARLWPTASSVPGGKADSNEKPDSRGPAFEWGTGAGHSRGMNRTGPLLPYESEGTGTESGGWRYDAYARRTWPVSLMNQNLDLGLSLNADRSSLGGTSAYEAGLKAEVPDGILADLSLSFTAGVGKTRDWGSRRYYDLLASKAWYFEGPDARFEAGCSSQRDGRWGRLEDDAWAKASRDIPIGDDGSIRGSFEVAATRQASQAARYAVPVWYVDDVAPNPFLRFPAAAGERILALEAPQSYYSFSPSFSYAFSLPAGLQAQAVAWYALDIYPEYAWDRIPWPDTLDPSSGNMAGLALNRADGRYYPAILVEQGGTYREYYGTLPLEHGKSRRVDDRIGLDVKLWKELPRGYFLSVESSAGLGWTNLARTAPASFRPWQWGLSLTVGRSSI